MTLQAFKRLVSANGSQGKQPCAQWIEPKRTTDCVGEVEHALAEAVDDGLSLSRDALQPCDTDVLSIGSSAVSSASKPSARGSKCATSPTLLT